jgi:hypothetical protein
MPSVLEKSDRMDAGDRALTTYIAGSGSCLGHRPVKCVMMSVVAAATHVLTASFVPASADAPISSTTPRSP